VRRPFIAGLILFLALAIPALTDQLILKNGDRLTGSIAKSDGKTLVIKTDYAGDVTVKLDAIQSLTSTGDLHVTAGGKSAVGPVTTSGTDVVVAAKTGGPVQSPIASVTLMRSPAEQAAYEKTLHPGLLEGWTGGLNLGFALTAGNSETKNLNIAFNGVRKGFRDKLVLYENSVYAVSDKLNRVPISPSQTTANSNGGGIRYDRDFAPRIFGFGSGDFFGNSLQDLNLRSILGGGLGLHAIKSPATTLDLLLGANYTHESYSVPINPPDPAQSQNLAALTIGDTFTHKLGKSTNVTQSFQFYPDLSNTSQYRFTFNFGTVTKLSKWLGWQNAIADVYVSNPPGVPVTVPPTPRIERNDLQISTGLNISFAH